MYRFCFFWHHHPWSPLLPCGLPCLHLDCSQGLLHAVILGLLFTIIPGIPPLLSPVRSSVTNGKTECEEKHLPMISGPSVLSKFLCLSVSVRFLPAWHTSIHWKARGTQDGWEASVVGTRGSRGWNNLSKMPAPALMPVVNSLALLTRDSKCWLTKPEVLWIHHLYPNNPLTR